MHVSERLARQAITSTRGQFPNIFHDNEDAYNLLWEHMGRLNIGESHLVRIHRLFRTVLDRTSAMDCCKLDTIICGVVYYYFRHVLQDAARARIVVHLGNASDNAVSKICKLIHREMKRSE
jgi:hypothetical protein